MVPMAVRRVLMLMVEVLLPFGEAHGGEALGVEAGVVASAAEAVAAELEDRMEGAGVLRGVAPPLCCHRPGLKYVFATSAMARASCREAESDSAPMFWMTAQLAGGCGAGNAFGKDAHGCLVFARLARRGVAADDVVIQHRFKLPAFGACESGQVPASQQTLFFSGDGDEDDGRRKLELRESARGLERYGDPGGVVIRAGRRVVGIEVVCVAGVVVSGDEHPPLGLRGIGALEHRVDVLQARLFFDSRVWRRIAGLDEVVALDLQAAAAGLGDARVLAEEPVSGGGDAGSGGQVGVHAGEGRTVVEGDQLFDVGVNLRGRDRPEGLRDGGVGRSGRDGLAEGHAGGGRVTRAGSLGAEQGRSQARCGDCEQEEHAGTVWLRHGVKLLWSLAMCR